MALIGEVIYEDYLYKFTGKSRSILWGKANPWRQKFFSIKRVGNKPVLEFFTKKPKNRNVPPKGKVELWPSFRVEKVTNMKNRAYVFQITTPDVTLCLSTDEQRTMDIFVFFLQIQMRLKDEIREDLFLVNPENSEAHRRIGAKSTACLLHVSPYGLSLALQTNRSILAQWPLKSIRSYESSERGQLSLEAGRVAPMGDGVYIVRTELGADNMLYDLIDRYVLDALEQVQPGNRGGSEEIEDYVIEAERLLSLTAVSACTADNPDIRHILQENWCTDLPLHVTGQSRPRQVVHTRLTTAGSVGSLNSQNSGTTAQSVPARLACETSASGSSGRNSPQVPRSLPTAFQNSPLVNGARRGSNQSQSNLADRPPPPLPSASSIPNKIPAQRPVPPSSGPYLKMNHSVSMSDSSPGSPFTPPSADWVQPPSFRDAMRQKSTSPIAAVEPYQADAYLHPAFDSPITSTPIGKNGNQTYVRDHYLTPLSDPAEKNIGQGANNGYNQAARPKVLSNTDNGIAKAHRFVKHQNHRSPPGKKKNVDIHQKVPMSEHTRFRRLRSVSCEDLSDYLRNVMYDPVSKSMSNLLDEKQDEVEEEIEPEPFPRLHTFSGVIDRNSMLENYYNIEGLKGKIYDGPGLTVAEIRKRFSKRSQSRIRRSVSNPSFIGSLSLEKLNMARLSIGLMTSNDVESHHSHLSLKDLLPEALRRHMNHKESHHKSSHGNLSVATVSSKNSSKPSSCGSSRPSSVHSSPSNSLSRKARHNHHHSEDIVASTTVKGINITKRSRSFRRQKAYDCEPVQHNQTGNEKTGNQSDAQAKGDHSSPTTEIKGDNNTNENSAVNSSHKETSENQRDSQEPEQVTMENIQSSQKAESSLKTKQKKAPRVFHKPKTAPKPGNNLVLTADGEQVNATTTV